MNQDVLDDIMRRIYDENPSAWPYGLKRSMLDHSFLVKDPATQTPAGFTGWQVRRDDHGVKHGYYAIGILPEHRRKGLAKQALQQMFTQHKPKGVQSIRAFIMPDNTPSLNLAARLGVPVQHKSAALRLLKPAGSFGGMFVPFMPQTKSAGVGRLAAFGKGLSKFFTNPWTTPALAAPAYDALTLRPHEGQGFGDAWLHNNVPERTRMGLMNYLLLRGGSMAAKGTVSAARSMSGIKSPLTAGASKMIQNSALLPGAAGLVFKDVGLNNLFTGPRMAEAMEVMAKKSPTTAPPAASSFADATKWVGDHPWLSGAGALIGAGGLVAGGLAARDALGQLKDVASRDERGRIRVTLPTRKPGDAETQIDVPLQQVPISDALFGRLQRDVRSRLHNETKERTRRVNLSPEEKARRAEILNSLRQRSLL